MKIAIAGTGYVGLSNAILLAQHNEVIAIDIVPEKVEMINRKQSTIEDVEIEDYLHNKILNLKASLDKSRPMPEPTMSSSPHLPTTIPRPTISTPALSKQSSGM